jgi:hypothetical protein
VLDEQSLPVAGSGSGLLPLRPLRPQVPQSPTIGASPADLRSAERRSLESLAERNKFATTAVGIKGPSTPTLQHATSGPSADTFTSTRYGGNGLWPRIRLTGRGQAIPAMPRGENASAGWPMRQSTRRGRARWEVATPRRHIDGSSKRAWRPCRRIPFGRLLAAGCWEARSSSTECELG